MDVPTGWVQVLRGPRPPSQKWPSVPRPDQQRQSEVPRSGGHVQSNRVQPTRVNPDASREVARAKIATLEKALEVMGECQAPAVEALKAELERTRGAAKRPPINVEVDECRKFIQRSEKRIQELDAERAAESPSRKRRIASNGWRSSKHNSSIPMRTQLRFQRPLQKCRGCRHWLPSCNPNLSRLQVQHP